MLTNNRTNIKLPLGSNISDLHGQSQFLRNRAMSCGTHAFVLYKKTSFRELESIKAFPLNNCSVVGYKNVSGLIKQSGL